MITLSECVLAQSSRMTPQEPFEINDSIAIGIIHIGARHNASHGRRGCEKRAFVNEAVPAVGQSRVLAKDMWPRSKSGRKSGSIATICIP
jgi:hypothetical protein